MGLPVPGVPANPVYTQTGEGTIASVLFYSGTSTANKVNPLITTTTAHGLKTGDNVILDYPGIEAAAYEVYIPPGSAATTFTVKGLRLKQAVFGRVVRPANVKGVAQPVRVYAQNHGFSAGDKVALIWSGSTTNPPGVAINTVYEISYVDANSFDLVGTEVSNTTADVLSGRGRQWVIRVSAAANAFNGPGTDGNVTVSWDATNVRYGVSTLPEGDANQWTRTDVAANLRDRAYLVTWVNGYGEEGPPSSPTSVFQVTPDIPVVFSSLPTESLNGPNDYWITALRLYRTDAAGAWRFVTELSYGTQAYTDSTLDVDLGEVLATEGWYAPPDDLQGLTLMPNGSLIGFSGKTVLASKPYVGGAWPYEYRVQVDQAVKGLVVTAAGVVVATEGKPALLIGSDPSGWSVEKLEIPQACTNGRSVVDMGDYGIYASPDGLVAIQQNDAKVVTAGVFSREQWQALSPSGLFGSFYEGRYFGAYGSAAARAAFVFNPAEGDFVGVSVPVPPAAFYNDLLTDTLYFLGVDGWIYAWDRGSSYLTFSWSSKLFQAPYPVNLAAGQVVAEGPVNFTLVADGSTVHSQTVSDGNPFRLPGGFKARDWRMTLSGSARTRFMAVAGSVAELREV